MPVLPDRDVIDQLFSGNSADPFSLLGMHAADNGLQVRALLPDASEVWLLEQQSGRRLVQLNCDDPRGFFSATVPRRKTPFRYQFEVRWQDNQQIVDDPYRFGTLLQDIDSWLLAEGTHLRPYERLGAHLATLDDVEGVSLAVWAPNAQRVSVVGEFNFWDGRRHPMRLRHPSGVWEIFIPRLQPGAAYKYEILGANGILPLKADPMALATQLPPDTASKVAQPLQVDWQDQAWMQSRVDKQKTTAPLSIYELHVGSWQCELDEAGEVARQYNWRELAERLIPYVQQLGFTHVELMPIMEHPFGGSWGYQALSQFAPTARFGSPEDFAYFVNALHQADIGVILDWVPAHFPTDTHGLAQFDGTALYEYANPLEGFHQDWDTLIYNLGRTEVHGFMLASALHWLKHFHIDGLRVDAVASMLYRDYSRKAGEWVPNRHGGRENLEAIDFLRHLNDVVALEAPGALVIAEESTAWPGVSQPTQQGGLGFNYKWNMGWMHDSLHYIQQDPVYRAHHHNELSFGLVYAWSERFILPISHDEVVHGKHSLIDKMPGDRWQKFANLRAYLSFMWMHPGKKLLFMGCEFGQWREWNHDQQLDWYLLQYPEHRGVQKLVGDLNRLYREEPALHEQDDAPQGFQWLIGDDAINSVYAWLRWSKDGQPVLVVANFTPVPREGYAVGVPFGGRWSEVINSDADTYAGSNYGNGGEVFAQDEPRHGQPASLSLNLPPLGVLILRPQVL